MATCSRGWGARCPASAGKKCRCKCGGSNHGTARPVDADQLALPDKVADLHAFFEVVSMDAATFTIRDIGHRMNRSVTNDAEWVVAQLAPDLRGRRLFYFDSDNRRDEIIVRDGRFAGFRPGSMNS